MKTRFEKVIQSLNKKGRLQQPPIKMNIANFAAATMPKGEFEVWEDKQKLKTDNGKKAKQIAETMRFNFRKSEDPLRRWLFVVEPFTLITAYKVLFKDVNEVINNGYPTETRYNALKDFLKELPTVPPKQRKRKTKPTEAEIEYANYYYDSCVLETDGFRTDDFDLYIKKIRTKYERNV